MVSRSWPESSNEFLLMLSMAKRTLLLSESPLPPPLFFLFSFFSVFVFFFCSVFELSQEEAVDLLSREVSEISNKSQKIL